MSKIIDWYKRQHNWIHGGLIGFSSFVSVYAILKFIQFSFLNSDIIRKEFYAYGVLSPFIDLLSRPSYFIRNIYNSFSVFWRFEILEVVLSGLVVGIIIGWIIGIIKNRK